MSTQTPGTQVARTPDPKAERRLTIRALFEQQRPELTKLLPKHMSLDRLYRLALTECTKNPALLDCSAESWALAMQTCAAQGLYPDSGLGFMYLIPRQNSKKRGNEWFKVWEVSAQRGYQGDIQLARNSGEITDIYAEVVYEKDIFRVRKGLDRSIEHEPYLGADDPGPLVHVYAVAKLKAGETAWVHLTKRDVDRHKASSFGSDEAKSPWVKHTAAMWKKTAIHELSKWMPKATENMELIARGDDQPQTGPTIDISASTVPVSAPRAALDAVKDQLRGESAGDADGNADADEQSAQEFVDATSSPTCEHPECPPERLATVPVGKALVCSACGEELAGTMAPAAEREPGSDDGPADTSTVKEFAAKAVAQTGKARRGPIQE